MPRRAKSARSRSVDEGSAVEVSTTIKPLRALESRPSGPWTMASISEAVAVAAKSGLALDKLFEVVSAGGVNSGIFQMMVGKMLQGDLGGLKFAIDNGRKDLRYYTHLAESLPVPSFMGEAAHQSFVQASNLGHGDKFIASLFEAQEQTAQVRIVPRP